MKMNRFEKALKSGLKSSVPNIWEHIRGVESTVKPESHMERSRTFIPFHSLAAMAAGVMIVFAIGIIIFMNYDKLPAGGQQSQNTKTHQTQTEQTTSLQAQATAVASQQPADMTGVSVDGSMAMFTLADVVKSCELIIKGTVISVSDFRWNNAGNIRPDFHTQNIMSANIYRNIEINVEGVILGDIPLDQNLIIRSYGGTIGYDEFFKSSQFTGTIGDKVVLFLEKDKTAYDFDPKVIYIPGGSNNGIFFDKGDTIQNLHAEIISLKTTEFYENVNYYIQNPGVGVTVYGTPKIFIDKSGLSSIDISSLYLPASEKYNRHYTMINKIEAVTQYLESLRLSEPIVNPDVLVGMPLKITLNYEDKASIEFIQNGSYIEKVGQEVWKMNSDQDAKFEPLIEGMPSD